MREVVIRQLVPCQGRRHCITAALDQTSIGLAIADRVRSRVGSAVSSERLADITTRAVPPLRLPHHRDRAGAGINLALCGQASSCVDERRVLQGPRNSCILAFCLFSEHTRIYQSSARSGQR